MSEFYIVISYDDQASLTRLHTFTSNLNVAKERFDHLVEKNKNDVNYFLEMLKISEFDINQGFVLFFMTDHVSQFAQIMYQWNNNGLTTF